MYGDDLAMLVYLGLDTTPTTYAFYYLGQSFKAAEHEVTKTSILKRFW